MYLEMSIMVTFTNLRFWANSNESGWSRPSRVIFCPPNSISEKLTRKSPQLKIHTNQSQTLYMLKPILRLYQHCVTLTDEIFQQMSIGSGSLQPPLNESPTNINKLVSSKILETLAHLKVDIYIIFKQ